MLDVVRDIELAAVPRLSIDAFVRSIAVNRNRPICLLLGAGASISSGMPSAQKCIWEWKRDIFVTKNPTLLDSVNELSLPGTRRIIQGWLDQQTHYPLEGSSEEYSFYAGECYPTSADRRTFFHQFIAEAKPHIGYKLLALLSEAGCLRTVWTTNFDGLVLRACTAANVVCIEVGIDTVHRASRPQNQNELRVVSLHGDFRYDSLKNTASELQDQDAALREELLHELKDYDLVVIGYSGRDESLMRVLSAAYSDQSSCRLYWCGYGAEPDTAVRNLIGSINPSREAAFYIDTAGFDDVVSRLAIRRLSGPKLKQALELIETVEPAIYKKMAFSVPPLPPSALIKGNAYRLSYPGNALKLEVDLPEVGSWRDWLAERMPPSLGQSVVFEKGALCLADAAIISKSFEDTLRAPAARVEISDEDILTNGKITSLFRRALVKAAADALGVVTDFGRRIWEPLHYETRKLNNSTYRIHNALSITIVGVDGVPHVAMMPEIFASTLDGEAAPFEQQKALRTAIYGYQHNDKFDKALGYWTRQLVGKELQADGGGVFTISKVPLYAGLAQKGKSSLAPALARHAKQSGIIVPDAPLVFSAKVGKSEVRNPNPLHGLATNRPWDYSLTATGLCPSTDTAVICSTNLSASFERFLKGLQEVARPEQSERDYLHDFPGFSAAFGLPLRVPVRGDGNWMTVDDSVSADALTGAKQLAHRICEALDHLRRAKSNDTVLIFVPTRWEPFKLVVSAHERFNLHDYIKAYAARHGQSTQFVREETALSPQTCRVRWWLSLALYVKSMRTPWRLDALDENTAFVGIGYSLDSEAERGKHVLLGCSHLYSARGEGLQFRLGRIENPLMRGHNPFMSEDDARRTGDTIRQLFYDSKMHLPTRVVIHKRTHFTEEEQRGLVQGLDGVKNIELIEINEEQSLRYLSSKVKDGGFEIDTFPVYRGTTIVESDDTALLWVHGATPSAQNKYWRYYQGKRRIPAPLRIRRFLGQSDVVQCATEILGLSKMNWNTLDYYSRMPATLDSASSIARFGTYLHGFSSAPYDYRLLI
ncbi:SIR2_2 domain-containing protein [Paraburkholderia caribensis]|uniref:SIR2 family protein n=1 Tax=Paraburkholderia caribensis TaxID=75105 RepID=UPI001CADA5C3|nr:SIR2 family protein [Paraburkholderia caribensis]CAG9233001.1 SIR2_2 domain-containing protein [Paraburkholderia caribensis]